MYLNSTQLLQTRKATKSQKCWLERTSEGPKLVQAQHSTVALGQVSLGFV